MKCGARVFLRLFFCYRFISSYEELARETKLWGMSTKSWSISKRKTPVQTTVNLRDLRKKAWLEISWGQVWLVLTGYGRYTRWTSLCSLAPALKFDIVVQGKALCRKACEPIPPRCSKWQSVFYSWIIAILYVSTCKLTSSYFRPQFIPRAVWQTSIIIAELSENSNSEAGSQPWAFAKQLKLLWQSS